MRSSAGLAPPLRSVRRRQIRRRSTVVPGDGWFRRWDSPPCGRGVVDRTHLRAVSVSAERVRELAVSHGLSCISQELVPWCGSRRSIDCISVLTRDGARARECRRLVNGDFMREADRVKRIGELYD